MDNIKILDCTLRDGGRIIDCKFADKEIFDIATRLAEAKVEIIEMGFLRDRRQVKYSGGSTFFTDVDQIRPFIKNHDSSYVAFVDFGMFDFESLKEYDGTSIDGIRVGFTKKDFNISLAELRASLNIVKNKGYKLFIQGVNSLNYNDREMLELIEIVNELDPYGFGIVDTYGGMYTEDLQRVFRLIDNNLNINISIDFHSHNNYQMSFALAQEVIRLSGGIRNIIIDSTLNGMGKIAGNLNTELIIDYLSRKYNKQYEFDIISDLIDDYIYPYKKSQEWGYSIPGLLAGVYKSHPNNIKYLTEKFRLQTKDIKNLIAMIDPQKRQIYDYDNIEKLYIEYNNKKISDELTIQELKKLLKTRNILIVVPGTSILEFEEKIEQYIKKNKPFVISVNFVYKYSDCVFFGNKKRYINNSEKIKEKKCIITSNISCAEDNKYVINYNSVIEKKYKYFENSTMMLLMTLRRIGIQSICFAGFDGFYKDKENYVDKTFQNNRHKEEFEELNNELKKMYIDFLNSTKDNMIIKFLTPSNFEDIKK